MKRWNKLQLLKKLQNKRKGGMLMLKIALDAGHGGTDPGASGNGLKEKDITLDICKRIEAGLKAYEDVTVIVTRPEDVFVSLDNRTKLANSEKCDVLLSVHINANAAPTAKGFQSFVYTKIDAKTAAYQNVMHQEIFNYVYKGIADDRGKAQANLHMCRESNMAAILTENLFITNSGEAAKLADPNFRQKIAQGHINGLEKFLGLKKSAQPPPQSENPTAITKLWKVQVGAFEEKANATALYNDLMKSGYRPTIIYQ
jgi:N-acetylmuramoyl-L-alanine amidase